MGLHSGTRYAERIIRHYTRTYAERVTRHYYAEGGYTTLHSDIRRGDYATLHSDIRRGDYATLHSDIRRGGLYDTTLGHTPRGLHSKSSYVYNNTKTTTDLYEGLDDILNSSILTVVRHWLITDTDICRLNCSCCRILTN
jgi:hypothetical protein